MLAELELSYFLRLRRLQQRVEMARPDCKDEAVSLAESCLGEAQYTAARSHGLDHVLRAIGAGISKLLQHQAFPAGIQGWRGSSPRGWWDQKPENASEARSLPPSSAGSARSSHDEISTQRPRQMCLIEKHRCGSSRHKVEYGRLSRLQEVPGGESLQPSCQ